MALDRISTKTNQATFARDLGLFDATMIGIGAMIGAGIFVLTGIAAGEAGPAAILAFALNGLVTLLTAFAYAELASAIPRAGGGYSFVRMAFPGATGFIAGWMLWFAYTVACSLYALGFAGYFWEFFSKYMPDITTPLLNVVGEHSSILIITIIIGTMFVLLNVRGTEVTGKAENILTLSKIFILCIFIFFGLKQLSATTDPTITNLMPFFPMGLGGVLVAMGLTFIAFEGYDLIATVAEEIKNPEKNIPRATFIALGITVFIYLMILFVSLTAFGSSDEPTWQFLGRFKETAIVRAAENFMPAIGVAIIVFGGLLSTMSALNATVMAASRVAFSMGRDLWLPKKMSNIHLKRRTPHIAIITTGVILLGMALTLPIEAVGSAASLIFLLTFALVNLSVIALRRKYPEIPRRYRVPLYPAIPVLGFILNVFLAIYQFKFQPIAWYVTAGWIAFGLLLYYAVFEKRAAILEPQVLLPGHYGLEPDQEQSVIIALYNPDNVEQLLDLGYPVAKQRNIRLIAISVVEVPRQIPIHEGMRFAHHKESLLSKAKKYASESGFNLSTEVVIAHNASDGILAAAERHRASLLLIGWKGFTNARDRIFGEVADRIIRFAPCDLMVVKIEQIGDMRKCLLPTAGGPNAILASDILNAIAKEMKMSVTAGYVVAEDGGDKTQEIKAGEQRMEQTLMHLDQSVTKHKKLIESQSIAGGIAKASREFDLVVIGAAKEPFFRKMLFGEIPEKVARYSPTSVLVVKKYEGIVKSVLKKIMG
jgi:amino acid transporter/nucleotide-binding universal stress UspA family protein